VVQNGLTILHEVFLETPARQKRSCGLFLRLFIASPSGVHKIVLTSFDASLMLLAGYQRWMMRSYLIQDKGVSYV
jgi:hypothetical protein